MKTDLLVFSDDWGRHISSSQHLIRELLPRYRVSWINTIGTRRPSLSFYSIHRASQKMMSWVGPQAAADEDDLRVLDPIMWPSYRGRLARRLNRWLLAQALRPTLVNDARRIGITTVPVVADLVGVLAVERWVYYCVDDLSQWPGLDRVSLEALENDLVRSVDVIVAASETLVQRISSMGRSASLLTHGVDIERWSGVSGGLLPQFEHLPRPLVVFWGLVDRRLQVEWLDLLSEYLSSGSIVLVGPMNDPDPAIGAISKVVRTGPLDYEDLPQVADLASVLIMPYADLPATRAMQPLKLKEYLATGKPCVVSALPAVHEWRDACDVVASAEEFSLRVLARLQTGLPSAQADARARLSDESWQQKARNFEAILLGKSR